MYPEWRDLPPTVRVMAPAGYTTPLGVNGWSPSGSEFGLHSQRLHIYTVNGPVFNPVEVFKIADAWDCAYQHAWGAEEGSPYWNTPTTRSDWVGPGMCEPLKAPAVIGTNATSGINGVTYRANTAASGSQDSLTVQSRQTACWIDLAQIKTSHLGNIFSDTSPSAGLQPPVAPLGYLLEWEHPTAGLMKIEAAITEPITNTNTGTVYMTKTNPGDGKYGPVDGVSLNWTINNATAGGSLVPGYSGGTQPWTEVTSQINTTGKTWLMFVSPLIHDRASLGTGVHPFNVLFQRIDLRPAFRFSTQPSRYKFVPNAVAGCPILGTEWVIDHVETYNDPDVDGAIEALTDEDTTSTVRLDSAWDADWFIHYNELSSSSVYNVSALRLCGQFGIIKRTGTFKVRITLENPDGGVDVRGTITIPDGWTNVSVTIDDAFFASPPAGWDFFGASNLAEFVAGLGPTPQVHIQGFAGNPYEVDLARFVIDYDRTLVATGEFDHSHGDFMAE